MRLNAAPRMMNSLYQNSSFYVTAGQLLDSIYEYIDPLGNEFFSKTEYLDLNESVLTTLLTRKSLQVTELNKFLALDSWVKNQFAIKQRHNQLRKQSSIEDPMGLTRSIAFEAKDKPQPLIELKDDSEIAEYRNLLSRLVRTVNIKLDKIAIDDIVKYILPTKIFSNGKIFELMANESRLDQY